MAININFIKSFFLVVFLFFISNLQAEEKVKTGIKFGGLVQYDNIHWIGDSGDDFVSGVFLKEISFFAHAHFSKKVESFIKFDLANFKLKYNIEEAYVKYSTNNLNFKIGQLKTNLGLEECINGKNKLFIENSLLKCNLEENYLGASMDFDFYNFKFFISFLSPELSNIKKKIKNSEYSFSFRCFKKSFETNNLVVHTGMNYGVFNRAEDDTVSLKTASFRDIPSFWPSFGLLMSHPSCLPKYYIVGFEFTGIYKSLNIQSEMRYTNTLWKDFDSELYRSFYIQFAYSLTNEKRHYDFMSGSTFILPSKNKFGSIEVAFRYNYINIRNEGPLLRGVSQADGVKDSYNLGINWFIGDKIRLQLNYSYEKFSYRVYNDRRISAIGLRSQFEF